VCDKTAQLNVVALALMTFCLNVECFCHPAYIICIVTQDVGCTWYTSCVTVLSQSFFRHLCSSLMANVRLRGMHWTQPNRGWGSLGGSSTDECPNSLPYYIWGRADKGKKIACSLRYCFTRSVLVRVKMYQIHFWLGFTLHSLPGSSGCCSDPINISLFIPYSTPVSSPCRRLQRFDVFAV